jgi:XPG I-region
LTIFQRLARLYTLGVKAIFVFDGPDKPFIKRNRQSYSGLTASDSELIFRRLLELFGFKSWEAAGEAEAECAKLLNLGIVDLVVTDDVDALMFGAKKMITNWQHDYVSFFDMKAINEQLELDQDGLVLIGLLAGNDYVPSGSRNVGILTAVGLAKAGLAPKVIYAKTAREKEEARDAIISELKTNASGKLDRKRPSAAKVLPEDFPEPDVVKLLLHPKCRARSLTSPEGVVQLSQFIDPDFTELAAYVQNLFCMPIDEIREKLVSLLFSGYALQCVKSEMRSGSQRKHNAIETIQSKQASHSTKRKSDITSYFLVNKKTCAPRNPMKATETPESVSTNILCINRERQPTDAKTCHVKEYQVQINPACMLRFLKLISKKLSHFPPWSPSYSRQDAFAISNSTSPNIRQTSSSPNAWRTPVRNSRSLSLSSPDISEASDDEEHHDWKYKKIDRSEVSNTPRSKSIASSIRAGEENTKLKEIANWSKVNRQWMDSTMIMKAYPEIVREYEDKKNAQASRKRLKRSRMAKGKAPSSKLEPGQKTITEMAFGIQASDGTIRITQDESVSASVVWNEDFENPFLMRDETSLDGESSDMRNWASLVIPQRRKPYEIKSQLNNSHSDISPASYQYVDIESDSDGESILSVIAKQNRSISKA